MFMGGDIIYVHVFWDEGIGGSCFNRNNRNNNNNNNNISMVLESKEEERKTSYYK